MLLLSFVGLNAFFVIWGFLQEMLMTQNYTATATWADGTEVTIVERFPGITFLIFCTRVVAIVVSLIAPLLQKKDGGGAGGAAASAAAARAARTPYELTSVASVANTLSSYFQYAALKYVSFPVQVLAKACKMIPNLIVGLLLGRSFATYQYVLAALVSLGVAVFSFDQHYLTMAHDGGGGGGGGNGDGAASSSATGSAAGHGDGGGDGSADILGISMPKTAVGYAMITMYLLLDALTSNWQSRLFKVHNMDSYQMMLGVNLFSIAMTLGWLLIYSPDELPRCTAFLVRHPLALLHVLALALCNSLGQLFIYYTIGKYGALVFALIMTTESLRTTGISPNSR